MRSFRSLTVIAVACVLTMSAAAWAENYGPGTTANGGAYLSDAQQSYGQVVGSVFDVTEANQAAVSLKAWGLYYNYSNLDEAPPAQDDFTLRFHQVVGGDPEEAIFSEYSLGAGTRTNTGQNLIGFYGEEYDLLVYCYEFDLTPLSIQLDPGQWMVSLINDVGSLSQAQTDGYWHWVSGGGSVNTTYFRRENAADFPNITSNGFQETINWTLYGQESERAYEITTTPVPVPGAAIAGLGLLSLLGLRRRR